MAGWGRRSDGDNRWRMNGPIGCLFWIIVALLVILIVAAVMFGGFQKGTKVSGQPWSPAPVAAALAFPM